MGNVMEKVPENMKYCSILYVIGEEKKYGSEIVKELKKNIKEYMRKQPTIQKQLMELESEKYIVFDKSIKRERGIKYFYINWKKINHDFIDYIMKYMKLNQKILTKIPKKYLTDRFLTNRYLIGLIKTLIITHYQSFLENKTRLKTINELFNELMMEIIYVQNSIHGEVSEEKSKEDNQLRTFVEFSIFLEKELAKDKDDYISEFFDRMDISSKSVIK